MERVSRRNLLAAGSGAAVASALVGATTASAQVRPTRPPGQPLLERIERYALAFNFPGFDTLRQPPGPNQAPTGPAYFAGSLWEDGGVGPDGTPASGAKQVGTYRSFAWVFVPGTVPQFAAVHSLDFFGRGQLIASGVTDSSVAVTGGTGDFQGARGEIRMATIGASALTLEIDLIAPSIGR